MSVMSSAARADAPLEPVGAADIHPGRDHPLSLQITSLLVLMLAVVVLDGLVRVLNGPGLLSQDLDQMVVSLVGGLAGMLVLTVLHVVIQAAVIGVVGGRPRFDVGMLGKLVPYLSVTADRRFSRREYAAVTLVPTLILAVVALGLMWFWPAQGPGLVLATGFYLSGCVLGWWVLAGLLRQPDGCMLEDLGTGVRVYLPEQAMPTA